MNDIDVKVFIHDIFKMIKQASSITDLERILQDDKLLSKNKMDNDTYPKIDFSISENEIQDLKDNGYLNNDLTFSNSISTKITDPLTKLLYSIVWKNGDLKKEKHIIQGILDVNEDDKEKHSSLVFYQFGKYLTKNSFQPIIDQHVIRAFRIYKETNLDKIDSIRKVKVLKKEHKEYINDYKSWLVMDELKPELKRQHNYTDYIDKILFAAGKSVRADDDSIQPIY
jgi:hypothetical protein